MIKTVHVCADEGRAQARVLKVDRSRHQRRCEYQASVDVNTKQVKHDAEAAAPLNGLDGKSLLLTRSRRVGTRRLPAHIAHRNDAVVLLPFLGIGEDLIGFLDQEETVCLAFGHIGMVPPREATVGGLEIALICSRGDAKDPVVINELYSYGLLFVSFLLALEKVPPGHAYFDPGFQIAPVLRAWSLVLGHAVPLGEAFSEKWPENYRRHGIRQNTGSGLSMLRRSSVVLELARRPVPAQARHPDRSAVGLLPGFR